MIENFKRCLDVGNGEETPDSSHIHTSLHEPCSLTSSLRAYLQNSIGKAQWSYKKARFMEYENPCMVAWSCSLFKNLSMFTQPWSATSAYWSFIEADFRWHLHWLVSFDPFHLYFHWLLRGLPLIKLSWPAIAHLSQDKASSPLVCQRGAVSIAPSRL